MTIAQIIETAEKDLKDRFSEIENIEAFWTKRILQAFQEKEVSYRHFAGTTGYGNGDIGRDTLEAVFASVFGTEAAIVRPSIASGTAALAQTLYGLVLPGDEILSATGRPYDTMEEILGINDGETAPGSMKEMGVTYKEIPLTQEGTIDLEAVDAAITPKTRLVIAQRSRGYSWRPSLMPEMFEGLCTMVHEKHPGVRVMVDNCYGEFVALCRAYYGSRDWAGSWLICSRISAVLPGTVYGTAYSGAGH